MDEPRMLIQPCTLEVYTPRCDPDSEGFVAVAHLAVDIREVLPYLHTLLPGAVYNPAAPALTCRLRGRHVAFHPDQILISGLADRQAAVEEVEELARLIAGTWARRAEIVPDHRARQRPVLMDVYKLLPRTNCRACGEASCFTFAGKLVAGQVPLQGCPQLDEPAYAAQRARLSDMAWDLV